MKPAPPISSVGVTKRSSVTKWKGKNDDDGGGDSDDDGNCLFRSIGPNLPSTTSSLILSGLPSLAALCLRSLAVATVTLYVLNQKHMLPMPMGRVVSKLLFWPTLPITVSRRIGKWTTQIDNAVVLGGAPFGWCGYPEKLAKQFNVGGVINMCDEYRGPVSSYKRLGIEHLRLPTVDHFEPSVEDLKKAVSFISRHESQGDMVYVHCRAGHGRSAAAVYAWLLYKEPLADPVELNEKMCSLRNVRKSLWKQPNINAFRDWLQRGGMMSESDDDESWLVHQNLKQLREDGSLWSDTEESDSDQPADHIVHSNLGQVFSDEDSTDSSEENELYFSTKHEHYDDFSEDEKDYEMWKNYGKGEL
mmetsp:Transcript_28425/g.48345  ORF Transcript_28425/g.48345 Transcript_28425/m.48345 type:complete len:360 (+) Transcript_28425:1-1080(+)